MLWEAASLLRNEDRPGVGSLELRAASVSAGAVDVYRQAHNYQRAYSHVRTAAGGHPTIN